MLMNPTTLSGTSQNTETLPVSSKEEVNSMRIDVDFTGEVVTQTLSDGCGAVGKAEEVGLRTVEAAESLR